MTDKNKAILGAAINYTIAVITAMFIFLFCACCAVFFATSKDYITFTARSTDYVETAAEELKDGLVSLAIPSGLPENYFDDKVDTAALEKLNKECIDNAYDSGKFSVDTADLKEKLIKEFNAYAASGALASDVDVTDESLSYLADLCVEKYEKTAANSVFKYLAFYASKLNRYIPFAVLGTFLLSALGIIFVINLNKKAADKRFLYFSLCGGGLMASAVPVIILIGGFVGKISIASRSMHLFISAYVNNILLFLSILGFLIIGISVFILLFKKKDKKTLDLK